MADSSRLDQVSFLSCHRLLYAFRFAPAGMATTSAIFLWRHDHAQPATSRPPSTRRAAADKRRCPAVRCVVRWHRATGCPLCRQSSTEAATGWQPEPAASSAIADRAGSRCDDGRCIWETPSRPPKETTVRRAMTSAKEQETRPGRAGIPTGQPPAGCGGLKESHREATSGRPRTPLLRARGRPTPARCGCLRATRPACTPTNVPRLPSPRLSSMCTSHGCRRPRSRAWRASPPPATGTPPAPSAVDDRQHLVVDKSRVRCR